MRTRFLLIGGAAFCLAASLAAAQDSKPAQDQTSPAPNSQSQPAVVPAPKAPPLGDVARKAREDKKTEPKPAHVFTNDNLPDSGGVSVVGNQSTASPQAPPTTASGGGGEAMWRRVFAVAREKLKHDQDDLDVMQREIGKLSVQYYPNDPQKQLTQSVTNGDLNDKRAKIAQKQQDIQHDQDAIFNLEDQLRKSGGDPGWAR